MQYHLFSHNDLDGVSCGILAKVAFGDKINVHYLSVNRLDYHVEEFLKRTSNEQKEHILYITDISVNQENEKRLEEFVNKGGSVQLIDHHKTALHLNQYNWGHVKVEEAEGKKASATSLFYTYLIEKEIIKPAKVLEDYVELVRQYDTWDWDKNANFSAKRLNDLLYMQSIDEFEESMLERIKQYEQFSFDDFEVKLLDLEEKKTERYIRRKRKELIQTFIENLCVGIVHAESYHSELGNTLGKEYPHLDCIVILNMGSKKVGFRTIHDHIDVSEFAGKFGGGGHAKAAGCTLTTEAFKLFVEKPFQLKPLKEDARHNQLNVKERCALYENRDDDLFLLYKKENGLWVIEKNHKMLSHTSPSFEAAERHLKRTYQVGLAKDDKLIDYLLKDAKQG